MVPDLPEVAEVLEGDEGLVAGATTQTVVAVCSTVSPEGLRHLATRIAVASDGLVHVIDAPVSGGEEGVRIRDPVDHGGWGNRRCPSC